jgi:hypothetical protein
LPQSTMMGETVWPETARPKNENCTSSRDKTLFMLRIPSVQKEMWVPTNERAPDSVLRIYVAWALMVMVPA